MSTTKILLCLICALANASGQVLMKASSVAWKQAGSFYNSTVLMTIGSGFFVYCTTSIAWVYILKGLPLSAAYPFLALTFLLVPVAGHFLFDEQLNWLDGLAGLLIMSGIFVISISRNPM